MGIAVFVIANDFSAINVAIPQIEHDFKTSVTTAQWVVNAYALTFGVLIVTGGRLADLFGRRRAFFIGSAVFATLSVLRRGAPNEGRPVANRRRVGGRGGPLLATAPPAGPPAPAAAGRHVLAARRAGPRRGGRRGGARGPPGRTPGRRGLRRRLSGRLLPPEVRALRAPLVRAQGGQPHGRGPPGA